LGRPRNRSQFVQAWTVATAQVQARGLNAHE
jgi:hypothetical protein